MATGNGDFFNTVHIKPFYHLHYICYFGEVTLEFMNMPNLGFFLRLLKGDKKFRMHYNVLLWIMQQETKMGNFEEVGDTGVELTKNRFRLNYPMNGYVTTITPDESTNPVWHEIVFEQYDGDEDQEAGLHLTRYEFACLKKLMPKFDETDVTHEETRMLGLSGFECIGKMYSAFKCEICEFYGRMRPQGKHYIHVL